MTALLARPASKARQISEQGRSWRVANVLIASSLALVVSVAVAVAAGPVTIGPSRLLDALLAGPRPAVPGPDTIIIWDLRLPRVLLAVVVGAALGVSGAVIQAVLRNPLADPYVIGVSSGATFGAVVALLLGGVLPGLASVSSLGMSSLAFMGALGAFGLVYFAARSRFGLDPVRVLLCGVAVAAFLSAATHWLVLLADNSDVRAALYWTLGSLSGAQWSQLTLPTLVLLALTVYTTVRARTLNALALGDEQALTLGVDVTRQRRQLLVLAALLVAVTVTVAGAILFFALIVPHLGRRLVGPDHRRLLPFCAISGGVLMVWFDIFARMLLQPSETPLGVITSLVGAAFFLALVVRPLREAL